MKKGLIDEDYMNKYCVGWSEESLKDVKETDSGMAPKYNPAGSATWGESDGTEPPIPEGSSYKSYILGYGPDKTKKNT